MKFVSHGVGELILGKLADATEAHIAVAFFSPSNWMLDALAAVTKLKLIVSEEFAVNNPYRLEKLDSAELRSVPPDDTNGKLHAKVFIIKLCDGSHWILLGSANLTYAGMYSNQEACVVMHSSTPSDETAIRAIRSWFDSVFQSAQPLNLELAKSIFDLQSEYRKVRRPIRELAEGCNYWVLKTGSSGSDPYWPMFQKEQAIAVGWNDLRLDPSKVSDAQLRAAFKLRHGYSKAEARAAATQIRKFVNMKKGDIVLLCRGYNSTQTKDVHIHGVARVTGPFRAEAQTRRKGRFKHDAIIQAIDIDVPRGVVASALRKQTLRLTIHDLTKVEFDRVVRMLNEFSVHVEV